MGGVRLSFIASCGRLIKGRDVRRFVDVKEKLLIRLCGEHRIANRCSSLAIKSFLIIFFKVEILYKLKSISLRNHYVYNVKVFKKGAYRRRIYRSHGTLAMSSRAVGAFCIEL